VPRHRTVTAVGLAAPLIALSVAGWIGCALMPALAVHHPLLLLTLNGRNQNVLLTRSLPVIPFMVVAVARRFVTKPLWFAVGRRYGAGFLDKLERTPGGPLVRLVKRLFQRMPHVLIAAHSNTAVCLLAGAGTIAWADFLIVSLAGTIAEVFVLRMLGQVFSAPINGVLGVFAHNPMLLTGMTLSIVAVLLLRMRLMSEPAAQPEPVH
jgi:membrane protein DedA with SNARE-associated domain